MYVSRIQCRSLLETVSSDIYLFLIVLVPSYYYISLSILQGICLFDIYIKFNQQFESMCPDMNRLMIAW